MAIGYKITKPDYTSIVTSGRYRLLYTPKTTVRAIPNTLGILFFKRINPAIVFGKSFEESFLLIEVEAPPEIARHVQCVASFASVESRLARFYHNRQRECSNWTTTPPPATISAPYVYVTDRITEFRYINGREPSLIPTWEKKEWAKY